MDRRPWILLTLAILTLVAVADIWVGPRLIDAFVEGFVVQEGPRTVLWP